MSRTPRRFARCLVFAIAALLAGLPSCRRGPEPESGEGVRRVVLLGLDGVDWRVAEPLMAAGRMPHLRSIVERGVRARLRTLPPALSPVLWTTIATGQRPERHGIVDFLAQPEDGGSPVPVTSTLRRVPAVWNLLSDAGYGVGVVGWWATYPAEPVNGFMVSDRVAYQLFGVGAAAPERARVWPPELEAEVREAVVTGEDLPDAEVAAFLPAGTRVDEMSEEARRLFEEFRGYLASHRTYVDASRRASGRHGPALDALYLELPDTTSHLFMPYREPPLEDADPDLAALFGGVVDRVYEEADRVLGELMDRHGPEAVYLVCSDHGFRSGDDRPRTLGSRIGSGGAARWHRRDGILAIAGPGVRQGVELQRATILDVAPTILALFGEPVPEDMQGQVLAETFTDGFLRDHPLRTGPPAGERQVEGALASADDAEILDKLTALGYLAQESQNAANNRGLMALHRGDAGQAVSAFRAALRENPAFLGARVNLGRALMAAGRPEEARETLEEVLRRAPDSFEVEFMLGSLDLEKGDLEGAEERFYRTLALEEHFAEAHNSLGLVAERRGDWGRAVAHYRDAIEADPDQAEAYQNLGNIHLERGDSDEAERWYRRAVDADPFAGAAWASLARILQERGELAEAERLYREALRLEPAEAAIVWNNFGNLAFRQGDAATAAERFERSIELDPAYAEPRNGLGAALERLERLDEAEAAYRASMEVAPPDYHDPRRNLALLLLRRGQAEQARPLLDEVLSRVPGDAALQRAAARLALESGDPILAESRARACLEAAPGSPACLALLGEALARQGRRGEAVLAFRRSLTLRPDQPALEARIQELLEAASGPQREEEVGSGQGEDQVGGPGGE